MDLQAATNAYKELSSGVFPEFRLGLLHGRMKPKEKEGGHAGFSFEADPDFGDD